MNDGFANKKVSLSGGINNGATFTDYSSQVAGTASQDQEFTKGSHYSGEDYIDTAITCIKGKFGKITTYTAPHRNSMRYSIEQLVEQKTEDLVNTRFKLRQTEAKALTSKNELSSHLKELKNSNSNMKEEIKTLERTLNIRGNK